MPSKRIAFVGSLLAAIVLSSVVGAQGSPPDSGLSLTVQFLGSLLVYSVLGIALVAIGPRYARETISELNDEPVTSLGWGVLVTFIVPFVLVLVALTIIGLLVAIPGFIALAIVGLVATAVMVVWVGDLLTGADGNVGFGIALIGAFVLSIVALIPVLGSLVLLIAYLFTAGVVVKRLYRAFQG